MTGTPPATEEGKGGSGEGEEAAGEGEEGSHSCSSTL